MCGIIGYLGNQDTKNILLNGLKKLEYRGYDSIGIATIRHPKNYQLQRQVVNSQL